MNSWRETLRIAPEYIAANLLFVAEIDVEAAGFIAMVPGPSRWQLDHLWILPGYMRRGLGRSLVGYGMRAAMLAGAAEIFIDADPYAEKFYRSCGARRIGEVPAPIEGEPARVRPQMIIALPKPIPPAAAPS
ncbi:MAG: GNAT family N-acetyltransferase [Betaproteobacteria bacterium]|nr:GNAT family N-acetyltransferase [Betaproteobacteria bacterium]